MATGGAPADASTTGLISRSPGEIARVLGMLAARGEMLSSSLGAGALVFESRLRLVDPGQSFILLDACADEAANRALVARPRASFHASPGGWRIEFAAADPTLVTHEGRAAIRLRFPEVLVSQQRRMHERLPVRSRASLHFVADAGGVISFEGDMTDISESGIGFFQYPADITLEPGTLLKGCRIELQGHAPVAVDLEVRHSTAVLLEDGRRAMRSGCRFIDPGPELKALLAEYFSR
jgi:hypothetical protein